MTSTTNVPVLDLRTTSIPQLGFGVWQVPDDEVAAALAKAFAVGYRHIDTARIYGNERGVGEAIAAAGLPREDLFITTKLWNDDQGEGAVRPALEGSLERLGLEHVDLYLMHWPVPSAGQYVGAWEQMLAAREAGLATQVGVCNFTIDHLQALADAGLELPAINQVELSPYIQQRELRAFHAEHDIVTEDWSPLGARKGLVDDAVVQAIAAKHGVSPAQAVLRWHLQLGNVVIPKSVTPSRITENFEILGFSLDDEDMQGFAELDRGTDGRTGPDPATFGAPTK